jgi:putative transposase
MEKITSATIFKAFDGKIFTSEAECKKYEKQRKGFLDNLKFFEVSCNPDLNETVFMEDLNVQGMLKNHKLAKAIQEVGFNRFRQILEDKARNNYKEVAFVGRFYPSSKTCHKCGYVNKELTLNDREWTCPRCGEHHDRDLNAAMNILLEGERIIGSRTTEFTLVDYPTMDERGLPPKK